MESLLRHIDWRKVDRSTQEQVGNREVHCPPISVFRWWARRPNALIGALLETSGLQDGQLVSDPFSGGGTVAIEAARKGLRVYAQDLSPWVSWGLSTVFDGIDPERLERATDAFLNRLRSVARRAYSSRCPTHGPCENVHTFWVRTCHCTRCQRTIYLFPYSLLTLASRAKAEKIAFYGCPACGTATALKADLYHKKCGNCATRLSAAREPLFAGRGVSCPHCGYDILFEAAWSLKPQWRVALIQRRCKFGKNREILHFDSPSRLEERRRQRLTNLPSPLKAEIPLGIETNVLRRTGFRRWCDLYPPRQLRVLVKAAEIARRLKVEEKARNRLQLALAGTAEMAGYLCRWDRFHPKAFEALANHRFASMGLAVEVNPLSTSGRGTLRRRLAASTKAAKWFHAEIGRVKGVWHSSNRLSESGSRGQISRSQVVLISGDSSRQLLRRGTVELVLTDPPYYNALQYGELSRLFLAWARTVKPKAPSWSPHLRSEAVPNSIRDTRKDRYAALLSDIFSETARTLAPRGTMLLTYHSSDFRGWASLGAALSAAGFRIVALAVAKSENATDHPKRDKNSFSRDLVLECRTDVHGPSRPRIFGLNTGAEIRELLAAGIAIASTSARGQQAMALRFLELVRGLKRRRIRVPNNLIKVS